ncbi:MAG TPA: hypothetical protein VJH55_02270 [Candidatus Paceibacterota bacterium]
MNIEDLRDALIADVIAGVEAMSPEDMARELIHLKTTPLETMASSELLAFRREQIESDMKKYGYED